MESACRGMPRTGSPMTGPTDLDALVREYAPSGDDASHREALRSLETGRLAWQRSEFRPGHFTASGFVASPDGASLLLIHHARLDRWLQPGGHIEAHDSSVEAAARREVAEETGIADLERIGVGLLRIDAHPIPERPDEPSHIHIDLGIGFRSTSDVIGPLDEVLDARWVPFGDLLTHGVDEAVLASAATLWQLLMNDPSP